MNGRAMADTIYGFGRAGARKTKDSQRVKGQSAMSLRDKLAKAEANTYAAGERWTPQEEGDMVCGVINDIKTIASDYGDMTILTITDEILGTVDVSCGRKSLAAQINKLNPEVGEEIGIRYDGQYQTINGTGYNYTVLMDRDAKPTAKQQVKAGAAKAANPADDKEDPFADE